MGNRSDGYEPISLPDKQDNPKLQRLLISDLETMLKKHPTYAVAVQLQKAKRDLSDMVPRPTLVVTNPTQNT